MLRLKGTPDMASPDAARDELAIFDETDPRAHRCYFGLFLEQLTSLHEMVKRKSVTPTALPEMSKIILKDSEIRKQNCERPL
jgi:hypothetical protein